MKKLIIMSGVSMVLGIVLVIAMRDTVVCRIPYLQMHRWELFARNSVDYANIFWKLLWVRAKVFAVIVLLLVTRWRNKVFYSGWCISSCIMGYWMGTLVKALGMKGVLIVLASVLPHGLVYGLCIYLCFSRMEECYYRNTNHRIRQIGLGLVICGVFLLGCMLETIIGTRLLHWTARALFLS